MRSNPAAKHALMICSAVAGSQWTDTSVGRKSTAPVVERGAGAVQTGSLAAGGAGAIGFRGRL
jgi:hypothetical protein